MAPLVESGIARVCWRCGDWFARRIEVYSGVSAEQVSEDRIAKPIAAYAVETIVGISVLIAETIVDFQPMPEKHRGHTVVVTFPVLVVCAEVNIAVAASPLH